MAYIIRSIRCEIATSAFFLPLRDASDQYLFANQRFRLLETAHAASHRADLMCEFPLTERILFLFPALS